MQLSHANEALTELQSKLGELKTVEALDEIFLEIAIQASYTSISYYRLTISGEPIRPVRICGVDRSNWFELYLERGYANIDPVIPLIFQSSLPFTLREAEGRGARPAVALMQRERHAHWATDAVVCPTHGAHAEHGVVLLTADETVQLDPANRIAVQVFCTTYASVARQLTYRKPKLHLDNISLSNRERHCIYWISQAKSSTDIAVILGLSAHTVRKYVASAMYKLSVKTREQLVLQAFTLGLLGSAD
jgi:LuxR family transcriptional regulator, quorum-sensing system regulator CciR